MTMRKNTSDHYLFTPQEIGLYLRLAALALVTDRLCFFSGSDLSLFDRVWFVHLLFCISLL
jgi:hypothetical protein